WRISNGEAAAFRFSTVDESYAARTGSGREVGVIGVAVFPERYVPPAPTPRPVEVPPYQPPPYDPPCDGCTEEQHSYPGGRASGPAPGPAAATPAPAAPPADTKALSARDEGYREHSARPHKR